jgi:hypothetical protein
LAREQLDWKRGKHTLTATAFGKCWCTWCSPTLVFVLWLDR